ncbi:hypothetical protein HOLleu_19322 [Holothuria leucospilota]|uniref:Uncharacterized protein n=1 Tax=Holothuria leucospilota TaxID=206669 RepID=A0A9Q1H733_HOLLE|nr:hypothetical protein HOLleu_19322 [Holothuria leucospilota]
MSLAGDLEIEKLMAVGKTFGLKDLALKEFVEEERAKAKRERDEERKFRVEEREREKEKLEMELKLASLKKENAGSADQRPRETSNRAKPPKLPCFTDKDDLDAYLDRFERYAKAQKWIEGEWAINLASLLTGKALYTYSTLPVSEANEYKSLKLALLKRFNLTPNGYKTKFRTCKPDHNETASQYATRLANYFDRWIDTSQVQHRFEDLRQHIIIDQFLSNVPRELSIFVKERKPKTLSAASQLADEYIDVHKSWGKNPNVASKEFGHKGSPAGKDVSISKAKSSNVRPVCYYCRKPGHFWKQCRDAPKSFIPTMAMLVDIVKTSFETEEQVHSETTVPDSTSGNIVDSDPQTGHDDGETVASFVKLNDHVVKDVKGDLEFVCGHKVPTVSAACETVGAGMPIAEGFIGHVKVRVLRDTGCNGVIVKKALVPGKAFTGEYIPCVLADKTVRYVPTASISINSPYFTGTVPVACVENPTCDVLIGNIPGARLPWQPDPNWEAPQKKANSPEVANAVETRSQTRKGKVFKPLKVKEPFLEIVTAQSLREEQQNDPSLSKMRTKIGMVSDHKNGRATYMLQDGILYREFRKVNSEGDDAIRQVVVPKKFRNAVMSVAHESILAGHLGTQRTVNRILPNFFWPGMQADIKRFCQSCDICQRTVPKGRITKVPLGASPLMDIPFQRIAADIVGPIFPSSECGHRYILVIMDYATRYPEAIPMKSIESERIAEEFLNVFSRMGFPSEVLTDQGPQFVSNVMKEVSRLMSIKQLTTTPYNPKCNGLVERFNATLKSMLRKMCEERPKDWDRYIEPLLFAYRETPQGSTKFSPFELLFGRAVRGPMQILQELWTGKVNETETQHTYQYVISLKERLQETCQLARRELEKSQAKYKTYYDKRAKPRKLVVGDEALLLLPTDNNKLIMQWRGPFFVRKKVNDMDYVIDVGGSLKTFHINMLKKYFRAESQPSSVSTIVTAQASEFLDLVIVSHIEDVTDIKEFKCSLRCEKELIS